MPYTKRIICLAASKKHLGYCVAGKEVDTGEWVRPVSARPGHEISELERITAQGTRASVLDILDLSLIKPIPSDFQVENHLNNQAQRWQLVGRAAYNDIAPLCEPEAPLWLNGPSSYNGLRDQVPEAAAAELDSSLKLIRVPSVNLLVHSEGGVYAPAKRVVRARFSYADETYWLKMTDPALEAELKSEGDGEYEYENAILCVSLGEVFNGYAYKLVASVIVE